MKTSGDEVLKMKKEMTKKEKELQVELKMAVQDSNHKIQQYRYEQTSA